MTLIGHLIIWGTLGSIIYRYFKEKKKQSDIDNYYRLEFKYAEDEVIESVTQTLGVDKAELLSQKKLWPGMPKSLVEYIMGKPDLQNGESSIGNEYETWFYGEYSNRLNNRKYTFQVNIHNNIVMSFKDLPK